jgi:uncharacterized protein YprB with RNaseH-like and TPR domain
MIEHTFVHIQGIGQKTERRLWEQGIWTWHHFLKHRKCVFSPDRDQVVRQDLESSIDHQEDILFFRDRLSSRDMWRLFEAFKEKSVYLDIETSGGYQGVDEITVIGLYDGDSVQTFVNGINLNEFEVAIANYDLVITYNGSTFDLPFIRRWFPNISLPPAHIDLYFFLRKLGYRGGLKKIEKDFALTRDPEIDGMDGYDAISLWKAYQWGDSTALETLIRYNSADIVNLKPLMEVGYREMKARLLSLI